MARSRARPPYETTTRTPTIRTFRGSITRPQHSLSTLRSPGRPRSPRKTRFQLAAHLCCAGLVTRRIPMDGFCVVYFTSSVPRLRLAQCPLFLRSSFPPQPRAPTPKKSRPPARTRCTPRSRDPHRAQAAAQPPADPTPRCSVWAPRERSRPRCTARGRQCPPRTQRDA